MQRICIARAIISKPKLLLIDDILKGIDPLERTQVELAIEGALKCTYLPTYLPNYPSTY